MDRSQKRRDLRHSSPGNHQAERYRWRRPGRSLRNLQCRIGGHRQLPRVCLWAGSRPQGQFLRNPEHFSVLARMGEAKWNIGRVWTKGYEDKKARWAGRPSTGVGAFRSRRPANSFPSHRECVRPRGIGINRDDELFFTDNQGDWEASSSLHHIVQGRFHGHPSSLMDHPDYEGKDLNEIPIEEYDDLRKRPRFGFPMGNWPILRASRPLITPEESSALSRVKCSLEIKSVQYHAGLSR